FSWILLPAVAVVCSFLFIFWRLKSEDLAGSDRVRFSQRRHAPAERQARVVLSDCLVYLLIGLLLCFAFDRVMFLRPDGVYTGFSNNLGDLPFHLQIVTSFVRSHNFPPEDPTYAGSRFTYPFLADFVAALFVRSGASLRGALFVEN